MYWLHFAHELSRIRPTIVLAVIRSRGRTIVPDNQSCRVKDFDGLREARRITQSVADYNQSDVTTVVRCVSRRRILREWTNHRRVLPARYLERSFGDPDHELVIFVIGRDLAFPCLADSRFPSRTHTCETHALLRRTLVTIVSRTRAATLRLSALLRCITTEYHKFVVGFTEAKLSSSF